jgi:hypothetical protein
MFGFFKRHSRKKKFGALGQDFIDQLNTETPEFIENCYDNFDEMQILELTSDAVLHVSNAYEKYGEEPWDIYSAALRYRWEGQQYKGTMTAFPYLAASMYLALESMGKPCAETLQMLDNFVMDPSSEKIKSSSEKLEASLEAHELAAPEELRHIIKKQNADFDEALEILRQLEKDEK